MGETSKKFDDWFGKIQKYVTEKISSFVAFLFFLYAAGAMTALILISKYPNYAFLVVIIPALAGLLSYYNRAFATIAFFMLMILIFVF